MRHSIQRKFREQLLRLVSWRALSALSALLLVAFHLELLAARIADGSLFEPTIAAKWLGTLALCLVALKTTPTRGRRAVAFWLLVLVLHAVPSVNASVPGEPLIVPPVHVLLWASAFVAFVLHAASLSASGFQPNSLSVGRSWVGVRERPRAGYSRPRFPRGPPRSSGI